MLLFVNRSCWWGATSPFATTASASSTRLVFSDLFLLNNSSRFVTLCSFYDDDLVAKFGGVDVLYCNAGIAMASTLFKLQTPDVLQQFPLSR